MSEEKKKKIGTLIKSFNGKRKTASGSVYDCIILWYRDENGKKRTLFYDRPKVPYYIIKDKNSKEAKYSPLYISEDKLEKYEVYSDMLYRDIAINTNCTHFYDKILATKGPTAYEMKNLFRHPLVYDADMDIQDRKISEFYDEYEPDPKYKLHKCYFDIEVDTAPDGITPDKNGRYGYIGFPNEEEAPCPINIITLIDDKDMMIYSFVVRNPKNTSLIEFEQNVNIHKEDVLQKIRTQDKTNMVGSDVRFFNAEEDAIAAFFKKLHEIDPDYLAAWNECFDAITMMKRLEYLYRKKPELKAQGISGHEAMLNVVCDTKYSHFATNNGDVFVPLKARYIANRDIPITKRIDSFDILDGINWVDSEYYYAISHASGGKKDSYKLNDIAYEELKKEKLPFFKGQNVKNLPWLSFPQFYEYNVRDVLLLLLIEDRTLDFNTLQSLSEITKTRKEKVYTKSISLSNFVNFYARMEHYHMNCNKNQKYYSRSKNSDGTSFNYVEHYGDTYANDCLKINEVLEFDQTYKDSFKKRDRHGAIVSDPLLNEHVGVEIVPGKLSMHLFRNVCDQDLSALYPSIYRAFNLDSSTFIGKFYLVDNMLKQRLKDKYDYTGLFKLSEKDDDNSDIDDDDILDDDNLDNESTTAETNDLGPTIVDSLLSQNWERIGEKYFMLPSIEETYDYFDKYLEQRKN